MAAGVDRQWLSCHIVAPHARKKACLRGLDFIFSLAMQPANFSAFGEDALQCFLETASVTGDPLRRRVLLYVEALGHRLRLEIQRKGWVHGLFPTPMEVMDALVSLHCLERMGLAAEFKLELAVFLQSAAIDAKCSAADAITSSVNSAADITQTASHSDAIELVPRQPKKRRTQTVNVADDSGATTVPLAGRVPIFRKLKLSLERWDDPLLFEGSVAGKKTAVADSTPTLCGEIADCPASEEKPSAHAPMPIPPSLGAQPIIATDMYIHTRKVTWSAADYLGFDPVSGPPPTGYVQPELCTRCGMPNAQRVEVCVACGGTLVLLSPWRLLSNALVSTYYAESQALPCPAGGALGGARFTDVLQWLPRFRPYRSPAALPWCAFVDQCYLVTHVVLTLSNYGTLRLDPARLPHEFYFLREHLPLHMRQGDVHLVGEGVECLRVFGCDEADPLVQAGLEWLLARQGKDGAWDHSRAPDGRTRDPYTTYHATMTAVQALMVHAHRGWGPGVEGADQLLDRWRAEGHGLRARAPVEDRRQSSAPQEE